MARIRTHNRRKLRAIERKPVECARHKLPLRGNGWAYAAGLRFAVFSCPKPGCPRTEVFEWGNSKASGQPSDGDLW